jgi:DNA-binding response OmpR family regulator
MQKILIVEDHLSLLQLLKSQLSRADRQIFTAPLLSTATRFMQLHHYDLLILDRSLPDGDGWELLEFLKHSHIDTRIFLISNNGQSPDRIEGLQRGADDFLPKPFAMAEFLLRTTNLLHRIKIPSHDTEIIGPFVFFPLIHQVEIYGRKIQLRPREYLILAYLAKYANQRVSREMLVDNLWYQHDSPDTKTIDVYIRRLRVLLGPQHKVIETVRNYGYLLRTEPVHNI